MKRIKNATLRDLFLRLSDPLIVLQKKHSLVDIISIAGLADIFGTEHWAEVEDCDVVREGGLRSFLKWPNGVPSHFSFRRTFSLNNRKAFHDPFAKWVRSIRGDAAVEHVLGDIINSGGNCFQSTPEKGIDKSAIEMDRTWTQMNPLVQVNSVRNSNEVKAIPVWKRALELNGGTPTIDAAGCPKNMAFKEGGFWVRNGNAPENLPVFRHKATNLANQENSNRSSAATPLRSVDRRLPTQWIFRNVYFNWCDGFWGG